MAMGRRARIVHIGSGHPARHVRIFQKECRTLAASGYHVAFIAVHDRAEVADGVDILPIRQPRGRFDRICVWPWDVLVKALQQRGDLYHLHNPSLLPIGQLLRFAGATVVYDMHENTPKWLLTAGWVPSWARPGCALAWKTMERLMLRGMPVVFAEASYAGDYPWVRTSEVVQNMPDVDRLLSIAAAKDDVPTLVYLGVVEPGRGAVVTLEAMRILRERGRTVHWSCIGPVGDGHRAEILALAERYGLSDQVRLHGAVTPEEGWRLVAQCHIGVALLEPWPNFVESYPTKLFEYMGLGLPVITSGFPLYREVIEGHGCGVCVDPQDPEETAEAIERLLCDAELSAGMGARGRNAVREVYRWRTEGLKLVRFYQSILQDRQGGR